ncbi:MAG: FG-GAP repeat domain-containing protein, partial [Nostoc sp. DedVER01b]|nr:VCBS repeat-containing protein [Nostoc sp. DedVER01b]
MPGSTLATAQNIGVLTFFNYNDAIANANPIDYYKFSLIGTNNITLLLSGVTQNYVNAFIYYDSNNNGLIESGEQLYSDYAGSGRNGQITTTLGTGNYYIGITQSSSNVNSNYSLQLSATSAPPSIATDPGSTLSTAYNIGTLTGTKSFKEFVGNVDTVDYYKFSLTGTNNITL